MQVLKIPENFSGNQIKKLDGFGSKINGERIEELPVILIGQLGKNDLYDLENTGEILMQYCMSTLFDGQIRLSGRVILLECKDIPYLVNTYYSKFGFNKIDKNYAEGDLIQMVRILTEEELV